jgi:hypothetical protein
VYRQSRRSPFTKHSSISGADLYHIGRGKAQRERINEDTLKGSLPATDEELEAAGLRRQTDYRHDVGLRYS